MVSPCSDSVDAQLAKMERKVQAGAEYFQTQAVFEPEKFIEFMEKAKQFGKPVQLGVIIPKNVGMCRYMNANVAGIHVPESMIEKLTKKRQKPVLQVLRSQHALLKNVNHTARVFTSWLLDGKLKYRIF